MNIFAVDVDPREAARLLPDKLVVKMPVETAQIVACAFSLQDLMEESCPRTASGQPRKHFNHRHPSVRWACLSRENYFWTLSHGFGLCEEYQYRYGREHFCLGFLRWANSNISRKPSHDWLGGLDMTPFHMAMPINFKRPPTEGQTPYETAVLSYRHYVANKPYKEYTRRSAPLWFNEYRWVDMEMP